MQSITLLSDKSKVQAARVLNAARNIADLYDKTVRLHGGSGLSDKFEQATDIAARCLSPLQQFILASALVEPDYNLNETKSWSDRIKYIVTETFGHIYQPIVFLERSHLLTANDAIKYSLKFSQGMKITIENMNLIYEGVYKKNPVIMEVMRNFNSLSAELEKESDDFLTSLQSDLNLNEEDFTSLKRQVIEQELMKNKTFRFLKPVDPVQWHGAAMAQP